MERLGERFEIDQVLPEQERNSVALTFDQKLTERISVHAHG